jgi:DNA-binding protein HU-beta
MSKALLAAAIKNGGATNSAKATQMATLAVTAIVEGLKSSGSFTIQGFGTFAVQELKAHEGRNPATGKPMIVMASKTVRFRPSPLLREEIQFTAYRSAPAKRLSTQPAKANAAPGPAKAASASGKQAKAPAPRRAPAKAAQAGRHNGAPAQQSAA